MRRSPSTAKSPFVIGLARVHRATVVTEETPSGNLDKPRIPNVCEAMGLGWLNVIGFVRQQGWSF
jgi:MinD superfamily P-loop ATPase